MSMRDITGKTRTKRTATARTSVRCGETGQEALANEEVPKGNPIEITETATLLAPKKTDELIPHCHNISVENCDVVITPTDWGANIDVTVSAVARTGVEMEALTAASVAALTLYDLLKPIESDICIGKTELINKEGGSSTFEDTYDIKELTAAVVVTSDGTYEGTREDRSGKILEEQLSEKGLSVEEYVVLPDESDEIRDELMRLCEEDEMDLVATTGGTGPGPRDVTADVTKEVIDRELPGIAEAMRTHGQERTPYAMFSRGVVGQKGKTLIVNFPGSSSGTREGLDALFPGLKHFFKMRGTRSGGHES